MSHSTFNRTTHNYVHGSAVTALNTLDVWLPEQEGSKVSRDGKWVIYIHGGAWRDPNVDALSFERTVTLLETSSVPIAGIASVNYRLSPYPQHSSKPSSPDDSSRNAKHPDHVLDVSRALAYLEQQYSISSGYMLIGHSAGAMLALQIHEQCGDFKVPRPSYIIGSEGIYDLSELVRTHSTISVYKQFITGAFGPDEAVWTEASPTSATERAAWIKADIIILSYSNDDELVDKSQIELMQDRIQQAPDFNGKLYLDEAKGAHDEIWEDGHEMVRLIEKCFQLI